MRRITRISVILAAFLGLMGSIIPISGCASGPVDIPDHRPGDFRLGVVVMVPEESSPAVNQARSIDARYIVESSSVLRASFGAGSTLDTYPGYTRRLNSSQMDALWFMARKLLETRMEDPSFGTLQEHPLLHAGQPQHMVTTDAGTIVEIHMNAHDEVLIFKPADTHAQSIVQAMGELAWIDTNPN